MRSLSKARICLQCLKYNKFSSKAVLINVEENPEFGDVIEELKRRQRKADAKRRQYGASFVDHAMVTVRGGKGGNGAAAVEASLRGPSAPSGGNGAVGGSVWLTTSSDLTSLATVKKRMIGGQGGSGAGSFQHGRKGKDLIFQVPVGTIIRELKRDGEEERTEREEEDLGLPEEERRKRKWQRRFIAHPSSGGELSTEEYQEAENLLKRERRWSLPVPSFQDCPPIYLDIDRPLDKPILLASGGQGGLGNTFFPSPRIASRGTLPPTLTFEFELKLLSDVGLVGFPNSGKSTLLRALTGRKAEVADYSFTTLNPQVGVVRVFENGSWGQKVDEVVETWIERDAENQSRRNGTPFPSPKPDTPDVTKLERMRFTMSDNPGLLPLAHQNVGLGHSFLRSIERSPVLAYVVDLTRSNPAEDLRVLKGELEAYKEGLSDRAEIVVLNKGDAVAEDEGNEQLEKVRTWAEESGAQVVVLSGRHGLGLEGFVALLAEKVENSRHKHLKKLTERENDLA
ncbi:hypothetical protein L204_102667 [Cryptococcus depauperatus]|nr:GTPase [Cryptococcus depauperatus CBS 7855]